jgi:hypothetical protein
MSLDLSTMSLEEVTALMENAKAEVEKKKNVEALQRRDALKERIQNTFLNLAIQLLENCGQSEQRLQEACEKLDRASLKHFLSSDTAKPLQDIITPDLSIVDMSALVLNKISTEQDWARRTMSNGAYIVYKDQNIYWLGRDSKELVLVRSHDSVSIILPTKGKNPKLALLPYDVVNFVIAHFKPKL